MSVHIGERLLEERRRLNISQTEMGKLGGVALRTYHSYESGDRSPDAECLAKLYESGVDVLYVVSGVRNSAVLSNEESSLLSALNMLDVNTRHMVVGGVLAMVKIYNTP